MSNDKPTYVGYLWYSDQKRPKKLIQETFDVESLKEPINPFVIEGQLWDETNSMSLSIKYVDGEHIIKFFKVQQDDLKNALSENSDSITIKRYIPHRLDGVAKLTFMQYWKREKIEDEQCKDFETLIPDKLVFIGFDK